LRNCKLKSRKYS